MSTEPQKLNPILAAVAEAVRSKNVLAKRAAQEALRRKEANAIDLQNIRAAEAERREKFWATKTLAL